MLGLMYRQTEAVGRSLVPKNELATVATDSLVTPRGTPFLERPTSMWIVSSTYVLVDSE